MKNVYVFAIKKVIKTNHCLNPLERINLNEKEENLLFRLIRKLGRNYVKIASKFNRGSRIKYTPDKIKEMVESETFNFKFKKNYWTPEEERILLEKHRLFGNKWSKISNYIKGRSDINIKNFFYSKFRRVLRRIIKDLYKDKAFFNGYIQTGLVPESKINVNYIYKILKGNEIIFEKVNKDIVKSLLSLNEIVINNQHQEDLKTQNLTFTNLNDRANICCSLNPNTFQDSLKENKESEYSQMDLLKSHNKIQMAASEINYMNIFNSDQYKKIFSFYSNSNSNSKNSLMEDDLKTVSCDEKSKSDCINIDTISETPSLDDEEPSSSGFSSQKELFEKEINFLRFNERKGIILERKEIENSEDEVFSFVMKINTA